VKIHNGMKTHRVVRRYIHWCEDTKSDVKIHGGLKTELCEDWSGVKIHTAV
jgi:hypothetical protein